MGMAKQKFYDAIVVGAGASGGWAAKELTEGGMQVCLLDAGETPRQKEWFIFKQDILRKLKYRGKVDQRSLSLQRQPIQSQTFAWEWNYENFVDDIDNPYTTPDDKPFIWLRSRQIGGRMVVKAHGRQLYRLSDYDFKAGDRDGYGENWPISYEELAPYYTHVERWVGMRGTVEGIPHLPDSVVLPHRVLTDGEELLKVAVENQWSDRRVIPGRFAPPPSTVPTAQKTGRLKLRSNTIASHIIVDADTGKAKGVAVIDRYTGKSYQIFAKVVVLCASSIESTRLLLNSATPQHPNGLGNSSGVLGHYLMDHINSVKVTGIIPDPDCFARNQPTGGFYIPQFRNLQERHPHFIRGYGIQGSAAREVPEGCDRVPFSMTAFGEMLPRFENYVTLDPHQKDAWGIPVAHISCAFSDNETAMAQDQLETLKEMAEAAGFIVESENSTLAAPGNAFHEVGTARMGDDPKTSVLNRFNQSWDVSNLFITDGSCFPSQGCQNPTLTIMALTVRACDYILDQSRKGNL
jgi:choline dehydrogenase-like flavoprotein